jgi:signal peptidase I
MSIANGGQNSPVDGRVAIYRLVKFTVAALAAVFIIKFAVFDTVLITSDQMAPALMSGDRTVVLRTPYLWPFSQLRLPASGTPVITKHPLQGEKFASLRVAGLPGDSMVIGKGMFRIVNRGGIMFGKEVPAANALLPEFAPRDSMEVYRLPRPGDTIDLDTLSLRDFFFAAAMVKQEQLNRKISLRAELTIDGKNANDVPMTNFSLFKGTISSIPETNDFNWFFWDRVREYWGRAAEGKHCKLRFSLFNGKEKLTKYIIRKSFIFFLADDWQKGFDSRYFGPVLARSIKGSVLCVLWSVGHGDGLFGSFRTDRIMKIVK